MFGKLRDWWRRRFKGSPPPVSDLSQDYDFQMLIQTELAALKANKSQIRKIVRDGYIQLGGNPENAKQIVTIILVNWLDKKLGQRDLFGPDEYIKPQILKFAGEFIGKAFDDFFTDNPNVPFTRIDN